MLNTKNIILKSAEYLFKKKGYSDVSIDDITKKAGVSKSLLFYYFCSKEELLIYLMQHKIKTELAVYIRSSHIGATASKEAAFDVICGFIQKNAKLFRVAFFELINREKGIEFIKGFPKAVFAYFEDSAVFTDEDDKELILFTMKNITLDALGI